MINNNIIQQTVTWTGKQIKVIVITELAFVLILAAPVAMTTMVYAADDVSTDQPVKVDDPVTTPPDDTKKQEPVKEKEEPTRGVCVVGVVSPCNSKKFQDPKLLGPGPTPKPFDCNGGLIDDKGNCIIDGKPPFDCNGSLIDDKGNCISNMPGPDESCIFDPTQKKCAPDDQGNCPPGFGHNSKDQCFPTHKCPTGFCREDNDESGACKKIPIN
jgi:hypothetical protein